MTTPFVGLLTLDDEDTRFLVMALRLLRRWCRDKYVPFPRNLDAIEQRLQAVLNRHEPSIVDGTAVDAHSAGMDTPLLLDVDQTHQVLGVSKSTVERLIRSKQIPSVVIGRRRMVARRDLDGFVEQLRKAG